jgi:plastocyanin
MRRYLLGLFGLALVVVTACAGPQRMVTVSPGTGEKVIQMKASSFDFDPNVIKAHQGDRLTLVIQNTAGTTHNFTVKNPAGEILVSKDLPEEETVQVEVPLAQVGEYPFYCVKPLHATFGMKGSIVVAK